MVAIMPFGSFVDGYAKANEANWRDAERIPLLQQQYVQANRAMATQDANIAADLSRLQYARDDYQRQNQFGAATQDGRIARNNAENYYVTDKFGRMGEEEAAAQPGKVANAQYNSDTAVAQYNLAKQTNLPEYNASAWVGNKFADNAAVSAQSAGRALAGLTDSDVAALTSPSTFGGDENAATETYATRGIINPYSQNVRFEQNQFGQTIPVIYTYGRNGEVIDKRAAADHIIQGRQQGILASTPPAVRAQQERAAAKAGNSPNAYDNYLLTGVPAAAANAVSAFANGGATGATGAAVPAKVPLATSGTPDTSIVTGAVDKPATNTSAGSESSYLPEWPSNDRMGAPRVVVDTGTAQAPMASIPAQPPAAMYVSPARLPPIVANAPRVSDGSVEILRPDGSTMRVANGAVINQNGNLAAKSAGYYQQTDERAPAYFTPHSNEKLPNQPNADVKLVYTPYLNSSEPEYMYTPDQFKQSVVAADKGLNWGKYDSPGLRQSTYAPAALPGSAQEQKQEPANNQSGVKDNPYIPPVIAQNLSPREFPGGTDKTRETQQSIMNTVQKTPFVDNVYIAFDAMPYVPGQSEKFANDILQEASRTAMAQAKDRIKNGRLWGLVDADPQEEQAQVIQGVKNLRDQLEGTLARGQLRSVLNTGKLSPSDIGVIDQLIDSYGFDKVKSIRPDLIRYKSSMEAFGGDNGRT